MNCPLHAMPMFHLGPSGFLCVICLLEHVGDRQRCMYSVDVHRMSPAEAAARVSMNLRAGNYEIPK